MLRQRVASAAVAVPLVLAVTWWGGWGQVLLAATVGAAGARELAGLLARQGAAAHAGVLAAAAAVPVLVAGWAPDPGLVAAACAGLVLAGAAGWTAAQFFRAEAAAAAAATWFAGVAMAALWLGWPLALWIWLRQGGGPAGGVGTALYPLIVTWAGDSAAYFVGLAVGRIRLAPALSPRKSLEGALAGLAAAGLAGWLLRPWVPWSAGEAAAAGVLVGAAGQLGDLWESALKRGAAVKDAGFFLPGHGGVLDRLDSLLLAVPTAALMLALAG